MGSLNRAPRRCVVVVVVTVGIVSVAAAAAVGLGRASSVGALMLVVIKAPLSRALLRTLCPVATYKGLPCLSFCLRSRQSRLPFSLVVIRALALPFSIQAGRDRRKSSAFELEREQLADSEFERRRKGPEPGQGGDLVTDEKDDELVMVVGGFFAPIDYEHSKQKKNRERRAC